VKFAICNEIFQGWKLEDTFAYAAQAGYQGVELAPFTLADSVHDLSPARRRQIREAAARAGVQIVGLHWLLVKPAGLHLTAPDAALRARTSRYFCDLVDCCADLGGGVMIIGSPQQRSVLPGVAPEQAWTWATAALRAPVARAEARGVTLCLEPLAPAETNFINTAAEAIRLTAQFDSPRFQIILDVKAMCAEAIPIPQLIRESWPHFAHFHANDRNLKGPGFGAVDFTPIAAALQAVGYAGWVSVEVFQFEEGPEAIATRSLDYLKGVFGEKWASAGRPVGVN
jgi:sugar phosphate isomerase/epimerase